MNKQSNSPQAVLVISSHVVRGTVGNRAAGFALEALGHPVWLLPTVTLAWHPGQGKASRVMVDDAGFQDLLDDLANAKWRGELAGVITGFMGNATQARGVAGLIAKLKSENPNLVYLCDPVIGDHERRDDPVAPYGSGGNLYVDEETAIAIRDELMAKSDIVTPNLWELAWLSGRGEISNQAQMLELARDLGPRQVLVTSVPALMRGHIGSVIVERDGGAYMAEHRAIANAPNGLGDLTAALFMSHWLNHTALEKRNDDPEILEKTAASVYEILARTASEGADELALESNIASLQRPMAMVNMRGLKT